MGGGSVPPPHPRPWAGAAPVNTHTCDSQKSASSHRKAVTAGLLVPCEAIVGPCARVLLRVLVRKPSGRRWLRSAQWAARFHADTGPHQAHGPRRTARAHRYAGVRAPRRVAPGRAGSRAIAGPINPKYQRSIGNRIDVREALGSGWIDTTEALGIA